MVRAIATASMRNVENSDILGSMEFACKLAGAKVVLVMGHTSCGAIKAAIDNAERGNLTGLLAKIKPAVAATTYAGERISNGRTRIARPSRLRNQAADNVPPREDPVCTSPSVCRASSCFI